LQFSIANYSIDGDSLGLVDFKASELEAEHFEYFQNKLKHLSGDLELPLEDKLPGDDEFLDYRIGSDINGAYILYYFHDEVIFASLMLSGSNEPTETELMQVFKFLLLDTTDAEEPTEEEIEEVLASSAFEFEAVESRPVVFEVDLADLEESDPVEYIKKMNRNLAAAFFAIDRSN